MQSDSSAVRVLRASLLVLGVDHNARNGGAWAGAPPGTRSRVPAAGALTKLTGSTGYCDIRWRRM
jgi:hypothetical protein